MFLTENERLDITKPVTISLAIHLLLFFIFYGIDGFSFLQKDVDLERIQLLKSSVRVDVVAMPKFTLKELKAFEKAGSVEKAAPKGKEGKIENNSKGPVLKKKSSFLNRVKELSKKKVKKKDSSSVKRGRKDIELAGNKISKGKALTGGVYSQNSSKLADYYTDIRQKVSQRWKLPRYLKDLNLEVQIRVYINRRGEVTKVLVHRSSGNVDYDNRAKAIVREASPFGRPDKEILSRLKKGALVLNFSEKDIN